MFSLGTISSEGYEFRLTSRSSHDTFIILPNADRAATKKGYAKDWELNP
jgi:hypothetical protein